LYINQKTKNENYLKYAETILEQDDNFIISSKSEIHSKIHISNRKQDYLPRVDNSDFLAFFELNLDGLYYNKYTRIYKKLPEVLAQVFGIMQPLMISFSFLVQYLSKYNLDNFLIDNFLYYFTKDQNKVDEGIWKYPNFEEFKNSFKNIIKNNNVNKLCKEDPSENIKNENHDKSNTLHNNKFDQHSEKRLINDYINRSLTYENIKIQNRRDFLKEINIELSENRQKENIYSNNKIANVNPLEIIPCINDEIISNNKEKKFQSFNFSQKNNYAFPYIGFFDYYLTFFIPKKSMNDNSRINNSKILKYFSREILKKMDLFYYLKLVRTTEILKNVYLRKLAKKEDLQFLLKSLYFLRDCDIESILQKLDKRST